MAAPALQAVDEDGTTWNDPSEEQLRDLLAGLSLTCRFVVLRRLDLEPADQHYIQVYLNDDLSCDVEYREGGSDRHFQAWVPHDDEAFAVDAVAQLLQAWAFGRPGWRDALSWVPWSQ
ncbi:hypothetical protein ABI214_23250 [Prescottella soli]|uniref:Uncharacterized protein n=1 Tax=Prescottella soli TaxID=1543852 RepID=A0ABW9FS18_9NOCA